MTLQNHFLLLAQIDNLDVGIVDHPLKNSHEDVAMRLRGARGDYNLVQEAILAPIGNLLDVVFLTEVIKYLGGDHARDFLNVILKGININDVR